MFLHISDIGLKAKSDGTKWRLHGYSYFTIIPKSINSGFPEHYGIIFYATIGKALAASQEFRVRS